MYLFILLLACLEFSYLGNLIAAVLLEDVRFSFPPKNSVQGAFFASPCPCHPPPCCLQNTSVGGNSWTERGHNEPEKEDGMMKNSTLSIPP